MFDDLFKSSSSIGSSGDIFEKEYYSKKSKEDFDDVVEMIVPPTKPVKSESEKPLIVLIDDDFPTIDLMKIYLQRGYEYVAFDNPREAIFYLNKHVPDLIFLDCYMSVIKAKQIVDIVRSYPEFTSVPIYLLAEPDEIGAMSAKIEKEGYNNISGIITRPVARGELQAILDVEFADRRQG